MKLGETVTLETECGPITFIGTQVLRIPQEPYSRMVLTPIPPGMTERDLGRKFTGARMINSSWTIQEMEVADAKAKAAIAAARQAEEQVDGGGE